MQNYNVLMLRAFPESPESPNRPIGLFGVLGVVQNEGSIALLVEELLVEEICLLNILHTIS